MLDLDGSFTRAFVFVEVRAGTERDQGLAEDVFVTSIDCVATATTRRGREPLCKWCLTSAVSDPSAWVATPGHPRSRYATMPEALPGDSRDPDTHDRIRHDRVDKAGSVTLRHHSRLHHIGVGRTYEETCVILLVQDLEIRIVNAATGELLCDLVLNPHIDYQPTGAPKGPTRRTPK